VDGDADAYLNHAITCYQIARIGGTAALGREEAGREYLGLLNRLYDMTKDAKYKEWMNQFSM
jgi:hypothetical protein